MGCEPVEQEVDSGTKSRCWRPRGVERRSTTVLRSSRVSDSEHDSDKRELSVRIDAAFRAHPEAFDHRDAHPWLLGCLGDLFADVWFVAENPSLTQVERGLNFTPEEQWSVSPGDKLFRRMLTEHGFKAGTAHSPGEWRCYITDVIKSADRVETWKKRSVSERHQIRRNLGTCARLGTPTWTPQDCRLGRKQGGSSSQSSSRSSSRPAIAAANEYRPLQLHRLASRRAHPPRAAAPERLTAWSEQFAAVANAVRDKNPS